MQRRYVPTLRVSSRFPLTSPIPEVLLNFHLFLEFVFHEIRKHYH